MSADLGAGDRGLSGSGLAARPDTTRRVLLTMGTLGVLAVTARTVAEGSGAGYVGGVLTLLLLAIGVGVTARRRLVTMVVIAAALGAATAAIVTPISLDRRADRLLLPVGDRRPSSFSGGRYTLDPQEGSVDPVLDTWRYSAAGDGAVALVTVSDAAVLVAYDAGGAERWRFDLPPSPDASPGGSDSYLYEPRVIGTDGTVVVAGCTFGSGDEPPDGCLVLAVRDGTERWRNEQAVELQWASRAGYHEGPLPDQAVATTGSVLRRFDLATGRVQDLDVGVEGVPYLIADGRVVVATEDRCRLIGVQPEVRTLARCGRGGGGSILVFDGHHALDVNGGDLVDLSTGATSPLPALPAGHQQLLAGEVIYRTTPRLLMTGPLYPTGGAFGRDSSRRWVDVLDLEGNRLRRFTGDDVDLALGTVTTVRAVHLRSPYRDDTRKVLEVRDPASGQVCARRTIDKRTFVQALGGCRALVTAASTSYELVPSGSR